MAATITSNVYRIEVTPTEDAAGAAVLAELRDAGLQRVTRCEATRLFFLEGALDRSDADRIARDLLADPVVEAAAVQGADDPPPGTDGVACEVHLKPGVMDPVALTTLAELLVEQQAVSAVRTARRYVAFGPVEPAALEQAVRQTLANDCIESIVLGSAGVKPAPQPPELAFDLRNVALLDLDDDALVKLAREGHLFLTLAEMQTIQQHFRSLGREPTDLELETIAQTWSEHCVHKTLKSAVAYVGDPFPPQPGDPTPAEAFTCQYDNLLRDTIAKVTHELIAARRGPECLSVFTDNAGVIGFDDEFGIAFKVETHNHPSAIEPYGGAATGIGGCIRDIMGCGRGAKPIAATDVFCVGPSDWPQDRLPEGVLHPRRTLREVAHGVADYGNRMGIPTVNGTVYFDPRYLGNPLVYCGTVGLIPRWAVTKEPQSGDLVVVLGGRTGRDGIHGATFSSAELTTTHADEFSHAVQIGNAITEKRCLDAMLRARDHADGCLFTATTDCGAGGLSSAVGEMGEQIGVQVELSDVPLKYPGLRYDEIWISEAQERMVLAVPPENLDKLLAITHEEEVEATVIGRFGHTADDGRPSLVVKYQGTTVGELDMRFLHEGLPKQTRRAEWRQTLSVDTIESAGPSDDPLGTLTVALAGPNTASKEWIIRQYDHEVQGGSVVKPLVGPGGGPSDAAVLRPRLHSHLGVAVGCGLAPELADIDPYWSAVNAIDEAIRNVVCVGGDPRQAAILDNFCWGRTDDPQQMGALVRACQACYDTAAAYAVPFISGKDSLNNEFALAADDVRPLIDTLQQQGRQGGSAPLPPAVLAQVVKHVEQTHRLRIPATLLISAIARVEDVGRCVTPDLKPDAHALLLIGGQRRTAVDFKQAAATHGVVADLIKRAALRACHDVSDGGWLVAVGEMALGGRRGVQLDPAEAVPNPALPLAAAYVVQAHDAEAVQRACRDAGLKAVSLGQVQDASELSWGGSSLAVDELAAAWSGRGD